MQAAKIRSAQEQDQTQGQTQARASALTPVLMPVLILTLILIAAPPPAAASSLPAPPGEAPPSGETPLPRPSLSRAELAQRLHSGPAGAGLRIDDSQGRLVLSMPTDVFFTPGTAALDPQARAQLAQLASELLRGPFATVQIIGHSDDRGTAAANQALSQHRAEAVAAVFLTRGWQRGLLHVSGRGASAPVASNASAEGRRRNRRVELVVLPNF